MSEEYFRMSNLVNKKNIIAKNLLQFTIAVTVFSQMEEFMFFFRPSMYLLWILLFGFLFITNKRQIKISSFTASFLFCYGLFSLFCLFQVLFNPDYKIASYLQIMLIPLLVSIVSNMIENKLSRDYIVSICETYVLSSLLFAFYINIIYFSSYQAWLASNQYIFDSKNSAAQIWCSAILITYYVILPIAKKKYFWYIAIAYLFMLCGLSQCRTAMLGLICVTMFNVLIYSKHKIKWMLLIFLGICGLLFFPDTRQFVNQAFLLEKYAGADMNTMSSGRLVSYTKAFENFCEAPFFGVGRYYVDCSYIYILAESGIIGFLLIEYIWAKRIILNLRNKYSSYAKTYMLNSFTIFYFIESLLEGQPPFGPGVTSFMFWMLSELFNIRNSEIKF